MALLLDECGDLHQPGTEFADIDEHEGGAAANAVRGAVTMRSGFFGAASGNRLPGVTMARTEADDRETDGRPVLLAGGCQCGAVRYALYGWPEMAHLCHCRMCQKAVGGPFAALAPIRLAEFAWTKGRPREFNSSARAARGFCADCGTPLSFRYLASEWIDVTIASLDDPEAVPPVLHYGVESRLRWLDALANLPARETEDGGLTGPPEQDF